jgi:hypothetical protein
MGRRDTQAKYFLSDTDHAVHILEQLQSFSVKSRKNKNYNEYRTKFNTSASGMIRNPYSHEFTAHGGATSGGGKHSPSGANIMRSGSGLIMPAR